ncbi:MAG: nitronate monooxygenase [Proteobacteria bacterium]|nr:nitronate monooxygenase [Pseudomonadota bacterium]
MKTKLTEMLGIEYPVVCGGMMRLAYPPLCAAISNAGGLGNLTSAMYPDKDSLKAAIRQVKELTDKPFWVNVTLLPAIGVKPEQYKAYFDAIIEEEVAAMEIGGTPLDRFEGGQYLKKLKDAGVKLFHKVGSVKHAKHAEEAGYDGVIAAGVEEGGHPLNENVATTVLTPRIAEELSIPVITAGGMADGRSLAAALCLGAEGILMATRFICTHECKVHETVYQELIRRQENETVLYGNSIGLQGRALLNDSIRKVVEIERKGGGLDEILPHITGQYGDDIWLEGKMDVGLIPVGQSMGMIHEVVSCRQLLDDIAGEAEKVLSQSSARF